MSAPIIRPETAGDRVAIHALTAAAFGRDAEANLIDLLRDADALTLSLVAWDNDVMAGHVAVSPVTLTPSAPVSWYGLGPIAVHPDLQGRGIGTQLMTKAVADTAALGGDGVVLLGDPNFYGRFGFRPSTELGLTWENGGGPYFQAVRLSAGDVPAATVAYHPAFDRV